MSWYLKKSFRFGPIRFNLSKSGIGVSGGVKGLRVGTGPRGPYVHAGRGGIYYRKSFSGQLTDSQPINAELRENAVSALPPKGGSAYWSVLALLSVIVVTLLVWFGMSETVVITAATALFVTCVVVAIWECTRQPPKPPQSPPDQF